MTIPVAVLTGFLGSGKTTLLRRILADPRYAGTAVIVNELGAVGLDHDLVARSEEDLVALATGCLCCSVRGDLVRTLLELEARRAAGGVPPYGRVVIETSGLADPAPILHALMTDADLGAGHALDRVVTVVDALHGEATLDRHPEARRQAALADRIVVSKTDLAGGIPAELAGRLAALNPMAPRLAAVAGAIAPDRLLAAGGAGAADVGDLVRALARAGDGPAAGAWHSQGIAAIALVRDAPLPAVALTLFLQALAEHCGADLLRLKGIVALAEAPERPVVVHGVQHVLHPPEWLERWPGDDRRTRIVVIGRAIPGQWPGRLLDAIIAEVAEESRRRGT
ncbi:MAG: GTP-binding protein [Alphaproteobacteria bacterium]|nr:GTP-binding protein [Alphaproteobacteria bacterium]